MVAVNPLLLFARQEVDVNQVPAVGDHGDILEPKEGLVAKDILRFPPLDHNYVLNANPEAVFHIIARFV